MERAPLGYRYEGELLWPTNDADGMAAIANVGDLDAAYRHCSDFRVAIQAGGHCGVWPAAMGRRFERVYTFEPDVRNFRCLCANAPAENVIKFNAALGDRHRQIGFKRHVTNTGAHEINEAIDDEAQSVSMMKIDDLALPFCDLIYLDIEGYELHAMLGAAEIIKWCQPVIAIENKGIRHAVGFVESAMRDLFGYRVAERVRRDVILVPA
jgi:FkbM family methyltransferase